MKRSLTLFLLLLPMALMAQKITVEEYIETYKDIAMKEMKCHKGWTGKTYTMDDDEKDECFRKYKNAEDSYRDHSEFLTGRPRYADLFKLDIMDYEGWAKGLKAAGYATSPTYATALINRIKTNKLYLYDQLAMGKITEKELKRRMSDDKEAPAPTKPADVAVVPPTELELAFTPTDRTLYELVDMTADKRFIYENNHVRFVYAKEGETPESISKEFGIRQKKLCKYNLISRPDEMVFHQGDIIYPSWRQHGARQT